MIFRTDFSRLREPLEQASDPHLAPSFENFVREAVKTYFKRFQQGATPKIGYVEGSESLELVFGVSAGMPGVRKISIVGSTTDLDLLKKIRGDLYAVFPGVPLDTETRQRISPMLGYVTLDLMGTNTLRALQAQEETRRRFSLPDIDLDLLKKAVRIECDGRYYADQDPSSPLIVSQIIFLKGEGDYRVSYETYAADRNSFIEHIEQSRLVFEEAVHFFDSRTFLSQTTHV